MSSQIQLLKYPVIDSTNSFAHQMVATQRPELETVIWAMEQSNGRGQRDNKWLVEPGKNLTFSIIIYPHYLPINRQFSLSQATAIAIAEVLSDLIPNNTVAIKWPNDIYVDDKKIGGLLLEHSIMGSSIDYSIAGIGINVNQESFPESLPNPTSMNIATKKEYDLEKLLEALVRSFFAQMERIKAEMYEEIHADYKRRLFRKEGYHLFETDKGQFTAKIADIRQSGELILEVANGNQTAYAFKEVGYIL